LAEEWFIPGRKSMPHMHLQGQKGLTDKHFDAFLMHFRSALDDVGVKPDKAEKVMKLLEAQRDAVLGRF
jgi:truncated hemoglobin YjbI